MKKEALTMMLSRLAKHVKKARKVRRLSQEVLALSTGLSRDKIARIEAARDGLSFADIARLAARLDLDLNRIVLGNQIVKRQLAA